ncbi:MAG: pepsin/retropepsin-like aspartic protease family protein, partial [Planctomycetota bacterium]
MMKISKLLMAGIYFLFVVCSVAWGQSRLTVDTKINGKDAVFAFDTGTNLNLVLFEQTVERFNVNTSEQKRLKIAHFGFEIGKSKLKAEALVIDSPPVQVDGLIGWPFLKGKVWAVLWDTSTLARIQSVPEQAYSWLQIKLATDVPVLAFAQGKQGKGLIYIDTGDSGGVSLSTARWKRWLKEHPDAPMTLDAAWSPAYGGFSVVRQSWPDRLNLGALVIPSTTVSQVGHKWPR